MNTPSVLNLYGFDVKEYTSCCNLRGQISRRSLRMRWLWKEWKDDTKPWVGLGNPCSTHDRDLFAAATKVTIGNEKKALFGRMLAQWHETERFCPVGRA